MGISDFFLPNIKGAVGEGINALLLKFLDREKYLTINDVYLPLDNGKTSQLDHVVISPYGIFVIETKNYKGWIFGDENSPYWTQVIYKEKNNFYNPIKQNNGHIRALKNILKDYNNIDYISIIAFSAQAQLKDIKSYTSHVTYIPGVIKTIKGYNCEILDMGEVKNIYETIIKNNVKNGEIKKEHIRNIRSNMNEKKFKINCNICPSCGGTLVERNGKYGKFSGCSNYPKCRFTLKE
ncbi:NERD domain-containing protein [Clostridium tagluense]|uniref:NERD domain-containing protein n=1 Tax=Clostridium tagluense TaxID=360422 RepID=UPI001C6E918D|nr:NERD domain-containing protein [Clostridium tagluense]MBW9158795.1 NERD domain-containing protein [Clostridium tagluense]WLC67908.1 NERD domain-containing protein [Clostridium tagluense]